MSAWHDAALHADADVGDHRSSGRRAQLGSIGRPSRRAEPVVRLERGSTATCRTPRPPPRRRSTPSGPAAGSGCRAGRRGRAGATCRLGRIDATVTVRTTSSAAQRLAGCAAPSASTVAPIRAAHVARRSVAREAMRTAAPWSLHATVAPAGIVVRRDLTRPSSTLVRPVLSVWVTAHGRRCRRTPAPVAFASAARRADCYTQAERRTWVSAADPRPKVGTSSDIGPVTSAESEVTRCGAGPVTEL